MVVLGSTKMNIVQMVVLVLHSTYTTVRTGQAKTSGHLSVNFGAHWRKAIGAALAEGQATVCLSSEMPDARAAERVSTEACQEFHPDCA
eukprot:COSAG01_NODE_1290_length_10882_cov_25.926922_2_plen_89_part_00